MPDREAFLRTILEHPDDDGPRLVYADWLEEQGHPHGEFIRSQIERKRMQGESRMVQERRSALARREEEIEKEHGQPGRDELPRLEGLTWGPLDRGFVDTIAIDTVARFLGHADMIFAVAPVTKVWFTALDAAGAELLVESEHLRRLTLLKNHGTPLGDDGLRLLADSPRIANLQQLFLNGNNIGDEGALALARSRYLHKLWRLFLHNNRITDTGARALVDSKRLAAVREVYLVANEIRDTGAALLRARWGDRAYL